MRKEMQLLTALSEINDTYIAEAAPTQQSPRRGIKRAMLVACLALILTGSIAVLHHGMTLDRLPIVLSERSDGVKIQYTGNPRYATQEACLVWLELEDIFAPDTTIFRGTVKRIDNIELNFNGRKSYRAIASIDVEEVMQGEVMVGETVRVLTPCPIGNGMITQTATEVIAQLEVGMKGIFMPKAYDEDAYWEENNATLCLQDIAPYGFWDGIRWAFLETDHGLVFDKSLYQAIKDADDLHQVEAYIREQLR